MRDCGQPFTSLVSVSVSQACGFTALSLQVSISEAMGRPVGAALVAAGEQRVLPVDRDWAHRALDDVRVDLDAPVVEEAPEAVAMTDAVAHGRGQRRASGQAAQLLIEPVMQGFHQRSRARPADRAALVGAAAADLVLDGIERTDAREPLAGDGSVAALGDLVEAAAEVRPAESERHRTTSALRIRQDVIGRIAVDLQNTRKACEMPHGMLGRDAVLPRHVRDDSALDHALGDDRQLLLRRPASAPLDPGDDLDAAQSSPLGDVTMVNTMVKTIALHGAPGSPITRRSRTWDRRGAYSAPGVRADAQN